MNAKDSKKVEMKNVLVFCGLCFSFFLQAEVINNILQPVPGSPFFTQGNNPTPLCYSPNGNFLAVANRGSASIAMFDAVTFKLIGVFSLGGGAAQSFTLSYHPSSNFIATGNRVANSVSVFMVDENGILTEIAGSPFAAGASDPDGIAYSPQGDFLATANRAADVTMFRVDQTTGVLTKIGDFPVGGTDSIAITFSPDSRFIAVANRASNDISIFSVNQQTGVPTEIAGSPFLTGAIDPRSVAYSPDGAFLAASNVGGTEKISMFSAAEDGTLTLLTTTPSGGDPRWLQFHPREPWLFVVNDATDDGIRIFRFFNDGSLKLLQIVPAFSVADGPQKLSIHPLGGLVAYSSTNADTISIFTINQGFSSCPRALFDKYSKICCLK